ncbi:hypothetical protein NA57DRAFT_68333 [Rhizodiscina lignyota]|uniref:Trafficking protein particle complex subunit 11 domain-containing protein n=1 Tax=Rhizodiscina lignyota TaxID=1504668 RepID=A0A9P4M1L8_9PEZI|nr:hypothetical protein NA57DRAFT_68333 [Rhizodiscina lignyota]
MDAYPEEYVEHNLPFIVLFGLEQEDGFEDDAYERALLRTGGFIVKSELPPVSGDQAQSLIRELLKTDATGQAWNGRNGSGQSTNIGFKFHQTGRKYVLPPRKANPPESSFGASSPRSPNSSPPALVLHSPLSPLSPDSPIFPDGLMSHLWLKKHQNYVPSTLVSFFNFTSNANLNSLNDNQLKSDINQISSALRSSGCKTRHVVVLVSDKSIAAAPDVEERLAGVRRSTGLDPKNSLFFFPPATSNVEVAAFASSLLSALQPYCVEYYRDLTKHSRRKKARGTIPPPTAPPTKGTSQSLSAPGWNVRYEFKLGVFAEFRQEMDAAGRHYNFALDALLSADGMFETTASWSPRWDEMRLLADATCIRLIRSLLWNTMTTQAVQTWIRYRDRIREIVDKRGKGSSNYGWEAWESRWARTMAELIQRADLLVFSVPSSSMESETLLERIINYFAPPEKAIPLGERLPPWHLLHHAGYWMALAANHAERRRDLAENLAEEDRTPPGQSPAALVASRHNTYDTYLCPDPHEEFPFPNQKGFDHCFDIVEKLDHSTNEFAIRRQQRFVDQLKLRQSKELMRNNQFSEALNILEPLWRGMMWRIEKWWSLAYEIALALHETAKRLDHRELAVGTSWELLNEVFPPPPESARDLSLCLSGGHADSPSKSNSTLHLKEISVGFNFASAEAHVADHLECQLSLTSRAHQGTAPITFSSVSINLDGPIEQINLHHSAAEAKASSCVVQVDLREEHTSGTRGRVSGSADLTMYPGHTKAFTLSVVFRESGDVAARLSTLTINTGNFNLTFEADVQAKEGVAAWWQDRPAGLRPKRILRQDPHTIKILPKPPKMEIAIIDPKQVYFTDEVAIFKIELANMEEEETETTLEVRFLDRATGHLDFTWGPEPHIKSAQVGPDGLPMSPTGLPGHHIGDLAAGEQRVDTVSMKAPSIPTECILEIKALYHLKSDLETPISKIFSADINFLSPFEANYDLTPQVHPDQWPSYFLVDEMEGRDFDDNDAADHACGLSQRWCLTARVASFAEEPLIIQDADVFLHSPHGSIKCDITKYRHQAESSNEIAPQEMHERKFTMDIQKISLEDRRSSALEMSLQISWRRASAAHAQDKLITSTLAVPRLVIPNSEPRVLFSARASPVVPSLMLLDYTLENPTNHFLTFDLTMEANEEFALSGPKLKSCNILPMSRQVVSFNVLPLVKGQWITPQLRVVDRYFNKTLKVLGTEGMKVDKKGISLWIDAEDGDDET